MSEIKIRDLFAKDIDRRINGVIKVNQDDSASLEQELSEYVVTRELSRHFSDFFESYCSVLDVPTDKIGVWISGFFGSGKSHFLKILSYLLSSREVSGKRAIDYFDDKIDDPMVLSEMRRACSVPTEAILFNIDDKASQWKEGATAKTALLRAFARVFYEHRGFYGENLNIARMEEFIDGKGKTDEFRAAVERRTEMPWIELREDCTFHEDDIVEALQEVMGWSETQARRPFERVEDNAMAPEDLVREINQYVERREEEEGGRFRLLFLVDEVGQFIGGDVNLMLNLQTIVEDLGARCKGRVWVMVTSQEAIDEVTKVASTDFSKIQGRFNTRLSLSSSSVEEVIKRRVLDKTDDAAALLEAQYEQRSAVLKNLFAFEGSRADYIGYRSARDFRETYPFVGYQFNLMRDILYQIRVHGNSGKHLSGGERSMLSGFQESAQAIEERGIDALVPLWRFYDTLSEFLEHDIRQVVDRCQRMAENREGVEPQDAAVLKTLYLIRYITDIKPSASNVSILMVDTIDEDKVLLKERVASSLARLQAQNFISRHGDEYSFLTNVEQDIAREIKGTDIDSGAIVEGIAKVIFDDIFTSRKLRVGVNDFPIERYVDGVPHGAEQSGMRLEIITQANPLSEASDGEVALASSGRALVVLGDAGDYYDELSNAAKVRSYVRTKNVQNLDSVVRRIIEDKQKEAADSEREAGSMIAEAIVSARCAVDGQTVAVPAGTAKAKLEEVLRRLSEAVYSKAGFVGAPIEGRADLAKILAGTDQRGLEGTGGANQRADDEMRRYLESQSLSLQQTSLGDVRRYFQKPPFGWRELDIAACVARLIVDGWAEASRAGAPLDPHDPKVVDYLTSRSEEDKVRIGKRERVDEILLGRMRKLLKELPGVDAVSADEDELFESARTWLQNALDSCNDLLSGPYARESRYPGRDVAAAGRKLCGSLLEQAHDAKSLFKEMTASDDELLDFAEDFESVRGFFPNQQRLFDEALKAIDLMHEDDGYIFDEEALEALSQIEQIVSEKAPYRLVSNLPALTDAIMSAHADALSKRKAQLLERIDSVKENIAGYAASASEASYDASSLDQALLRKKSSVADAATLTKLAALDSQLDDFQDREFARIDAAAAPEPDDSGEGDPAGSMSARKAKELRRSDVCSRKVLSTEDQIDAYVEAIRQKLLAALHEAGSVKLVG